MTEQSNWSKLPASEAWRSDGPSGIVRFVHHHAGMWRVSRTDAWRLPTILDSMSSLVDPIVPEFESASRDDCMLYGDFLHEHDAAISAWQARTVSFEAVLPQFPDHIFVVKKSVGTAPAHAIVLDIELGRRIGGMRVDHSGHQTCYIAGENTVSGHSSIEPEFIGKGFGRAMYDAVEQALGMTLVPSGRDFSPGELSSYSEPFWEKRTRHRTIPTMGQAADTRRKFVSPAIGIPRIENEWRGSLPFMTALAEATGGTLVAAIKQDADCMEKAIPLWVETQGGTWLGISGALSAAEARAVVDEVVSDGSVVRRGPTTLMEVVAMESKRPGEGFFPHDFPRDVKRAFPDAVEVAERHGALLRMEMMDTTRSALEVFYTDRGEPIPDATGVSAPSMS